MSTERIGKNGLVVGTAAYFEELNKNSMMVGLLTDLKEHHYVDQLDLLAQRVSDALDEMCEDLKNCALVLPYFAESIRMETAEFVNGIDGIRDFLRKSRSKADACISLLHLRDFKTRPKSRASVRDILEAVEKIQKEGHMWQSDVEIILKKARDYGLKNVSGDGEKIDFIKALYKDDDRDFYDDVLRLMAYRNHPDHYKGKCGKNLCGKEYIDYFIKKIFTAEIPMRYLSRGRTYEYADNIKEALRGIYDTISDDLFANGQYLSVENINKLQLVSDDMTKLISRGFDSLFKSAITDVVNVDGLMLDRDYEVLSEDDLALVKALSNEYLYYEQQRNEPVMEALGYEVVKIRQKAVYYDQYNRGPYLNKEGYESDSKIPIGAYVLSSGDAWAEGGEDKGNDFVYSLIKELIPGKIGDVVDFIELLLSLTKEQRAKEILRGGDIQITVTDWYANVKRESFYKSDGMYILSQIYGLHKNAQIDHSVINPDIDLQSIEDLFVEFTKESVQGAISDKLKTEILQLIEKMKG